MLVLQKMSRFSVVLNKRNVEACAHSISPEVDTSQNCIRDQMLLCGRRFCGWQGTNYKAGAAVPEKR